MRAPTGLEDRWAWWESQFTDTPLPRHINEPQCGYFKVRKFRWADWPSALNPWLPARIYMLHAQTDEAGELLEPEILIAEIDGRKFNPWLNDSWMFWIPITESEYRWLKALSPLTAKRIPQKAKKRQ